MRASFRPIYPGRDYSTALEVRRQNRSINQALSANTREPRILPPQQFVAKLTDASDNEVLKANVLYGGAEGTEELIARPWLLRATMASRGGVTFTYTDSQSRTADDSTNPIETQRITPDYLVDDELVVTPVVAGIPITTTPVPGQTITVVYWLDITPGRDWATV